MDDAELKMMPLGFLRKYGSFITNLSRYEKEFHLDENKRISDYYKRIKHLSKLQTDEEKDLMLRELEKAHFPDEVTMATLERERGDYMRRQPRINPEELSYNFEQYDRYSKILARSTVSDRAKSESFYKMIKYVKKNINNKTDSIVRDFTEIDGYVPELIEIPKEFEDLPIADVKAREFARNKSGKTLIRTRTSKNMTNYDAWRCHDRETIHFGQ